MRSSERLVPTDFTSPKLPYSIRSIRLAMAIRPRISLSLASHFEKILVDLTSYIRYCIYLDTFCQENTLLLILNQPAIFPLIF